MKLSRFLLFIPAFVLLGVFLSGCGGAAFTPSGWPGLAADNNTAYVAENQSVYAVNLANGSLKWSYPEKPSGSLLFFTSPVITQDGKQILVGSFNAKNNKLYSLDAGTGKENWSFPVGDRFIGSPLVTKERIYAPNADGYLYAIDPNGQKIWAFKAGGQLWSQPAFDEKNNRIFVASLDHKLYTIDANTGNSTRDPVDLGSALVGTPAIGPDGTLYLGTFKNQIVAIKEDGSVQEITKTEGWVWSGPVLNGDRLYVGDIVGYIYIIDLPGKTIIKKEKRDEAITSRPTISGDTVYFSTESGTVFAVGKDGNALWSQTIGGKIYTSPVVAGDLILAAPVGANSPLSALSGNGARKWDYTPPK